jgi:ParB family chromosome partitioning protein
VSRPSGLGRGLGALIPNRLIEEDVGSLRELPVNAIDPNPLQPRRYFEEDSLNALSESIRELGVLQPVLVRPADRADGDADEPRYELIAGERRWRAAKRAGLTTILAIVRPVEAMGSLEQALVENLHREDLNPLEEAAAYQQLIEDFDLTQDQVARRVGRSRSAVANTLRLFQLSPAIQRMVGERRLSAGHARALLGTPDRSFQDALAQRICQEGLSVRQAEDAVRRRAELESKLSMVDDAVATERPPSAPEATPLPDVALLELQGLLADYLDTKVQVALGQGRGRITIDFADLADLERIYRLMADPRPG